MELRIDSEFKNLIPPLMKEERGTLEFNLVNDGCRDPLVVWDQPSTVDYCKYCDSDIDPVAGDGIWECPKCSYGLEEMPAPILIDGHNRYEICTRLNIPFDTVEMEFEDREQAKIWIIENQFGRRNLTAYVKTTLALELESLFAEKAKRNQIAGGGDKRPGSQNSVDPINPVDTQKEIAKVANVSHDTVSKVKFINNNIDLIDNSTLDDLKRGEKSINRVVRDIKETKQKTERQEKRQAAVAEVKPEILSNLHVGDFRLHFDKVADNSLSLIFTDPPYDRKANELFYGLGVFASEKLAEGGSLICYVGQTQIPDAIKALSQHMRYWWTLCCFHSGSHNLMNEYGIRCGWKAVLWFVKGTRDNREDIVSDVMSGGREKSHHDWQQSLAEAQYWIEHLCPPDGIVCDPFIGGGTTAVAAKALGRKWIGFEINEDQAKIATSRITA